MPSKKRAAGAVMSAEGPRFSFSGRSFDNWFVYFPLLRHVYGPLMFESSRDEAGEVGIVLGPYCCGPAQLDMVKEREMGGMTRRQWIGHMLLGLERPEWKLTEGELEFLEKVAEQYMEEGKLNDEQMGMLERIYVEKVA